MKVSEILKQKQRRLVFVSPDCSVGDVAARLRHEGIGAVLVLSEDGHMLGILSERDIVASIAEDGKNGLDRSAADLMTVDVAVCRPDDDVIEIMSMMTNLRVRHLPVMQGDRVTDVVSIGDVVKSRLAEVEAEARQLRDYITAA